MGGERKIGISDDMTDGLPKYITYFLDRLVSLCARIMIFDLVFNDPIEN